LIAFVPKSIKPTRADVHAWRTDSMTEKEREAAEASGWRPHGGGM
jgi:hypothetical protein